MRSVKVETIYLNVPDCIRHEWKSISHTFILISTRLYLKGIRVKLDYRKLSTSLSD